MTEQAKQYIYDILIQLSNGQEIDIMTKSSFDHPSEVARCINEWIGICLKEGALLELTDFRLPRTFLIDSQLIEVMDVRKHNE